MLADTKILAAEILILSQSSEKCVMSSFRASQMIVLKELI